MAKFNLERIYEELNKEEDCIKLSDAFEGIKNFIAKKISQQAQTLEDEATTLNQLVQKIQSV